MRYVMLDRITQFDPPRMAKGVKCVSLSDDVFNEHFQGHPVMPGALVLESLAQLGGALLEGSLQAQGRELHAILSMSDRARFRRMVRPGDRIELEAHVLSLHEEGGQVKGSATVEGVLVAEAELGFAFTAVKNASILQWRRNQMKIWLAGTIEDP